MINNQEICSLKVSNRICNNSIKNNKGKNNHRTIITTSNTRKRRAKSSTNTKNINTSIRASGMRNPVENQDHITILISNNNRNSKPSNLSFIRKEEDSI